MIQIYPFHGTEVQDVYDKLNCFLNELAVIGVLVDLEHVRSNTKYYPDWDRTATTIEVCVYSDSLAPDDLAGQVRDLHRAIVDDKPEPTPAPEAEAKPVTVPAGDDYDPFLDESELL